MESSTYRWPTREEIEEKFRPALEIPKGDPFPVMEPTLSSSITNNSVLLDPNVPPYWPLPMRIALASLMCVFIVSGIVGNIMVMGVIIKHRGMRTRTNMFLFSLAVADLSCSVLDMPFSLVTAIVGDWIFGHVMCQFNGFTNALFIVTSIHTLMYISIHKYISITRPFSQVLTYHRILFMILFAWFWGLLHSYLTVQGLTRVTYKPYTTQCGPVYPDGIISYMHSMWTTVTCFLIPFIIMAFCYTRTFIEIRAHAGRLERHTNQEKDVIFLQQKRITFTLFMVLVVFLMSWSPYIVYSTYVASLSDKSKVPIYANAWSYWFGYMNSACNPIIYALRSPAFREGYKDIICSSGGIVASEETDHYEVSTGPMSKFRILVKNTIKALRKDSGSVTEQGSNKSSKRGSLTSMTNFVLNPKSRTISTSSLPTEFLNFRMSGKKRRAANGTQISMIAGTPVLIKNGKIVCYRDPNIRKARVDFEAPYGGLNLGSQNTCSSDGQGEVTPLLKSADRGEKSLSDTYEDIRVKRSGRPYLIRQDGIQGGRGSDPDNVFIVVADVERNNVIRQDAFDCPDITITIDADDAHMIDTQMLSTPRAKDKPSKSESEAGGIMNEDSNLYRAQSDEVGRFKKEKARESFIKRIFSKKRNRKSRNSSSSTKTMSSGTDEHGLFISEECGINGIGENNRNYNRSISEDPRVNRASHTDAAETLNKSKSYSVVTRALTEKSTKNANKYGARASKWSGDGRSKTFSLGFYGDSDDEVKVKRTNSCKPTMNKYPSVERLDKTKVDRRRPSTLNLPMDARQARALSIGLTNQAGQQADPSAGTILFTRGAATSPDQDFSPIQTVPMQRCSSDPCLTIARIEEFLEQKDMLKKWQKSRRKKVVRKSEKEDSGFGTLTKDKSPYEFTFGNSVSPSKINDRLSLAEPVSPRHLQNGSNSKPVQEKRSEKKEPGTPVIRLSGIQPIEFNADVSTAKTPYGEIYTSSAACNIASTLL